MSTIVTLGRGAQSATPFGFNAGDTSTERGSAFFTDFYSLEHFSTTSSFPLIDGACGLAKQSVSGAGASKLATKDIFVQTENSAISFAARLKVTGSASTDYFNIGMTDEMASTIGAASDNFGFRLRNHDTNALTISFDDATTDPGVVDLVAGSQLPSDYAATDFHVYGVELIRQNGTNTCSWFVDGKKVYTLVSTPESQLLLNPLMFAMWSDSGDVQTQYATVDWASVSMPRV